MLSIQLPAEYESRVTQVAQDERVSPAEIIRQALEQYFLEFPSAPTPYQLGEDLFGKYGSDEGNRSTEYKRLLKEKLHAKHTH